MNMETIPSPLEIRAVRGTRSRAEFAALVEVTPLTVYRWELPEGSPELRRPRGKGLKKLQAWMAEQTALGSPVEPARLLTVDPEELATLLPALNAIDQGELEKAEADL